MSTNRRGYTILSDQVNNLLQDQISLWHRKSDREGLCDKAADISVNPIPAARSDVPIRCWLDVTGRHIASSDPEYVIQDDGEVYNVAHHASDILLANTQVDWDKSQEYSSLSTYLPR